MIDTVKKTYNNGYYLVQNYAGDGIDIVHITNYNNRVVVHLAGNEWEGGLEDFHWITDEPLNLEQISLLHKSDYACTCRD